ncbi:MAG: cytochrome c oxidase assembly protein [Permianibacter sp.]
MTEATAVQQRNKKLALKIAAIALGMTGFGFAMVPLYDVFCEVFGINGKTAGQAEVQQVVVDTSRTVTVEFVATVDRGMPWQFEPEVKKLKVHPGEMHKVNFKVANRTGERIVGQAVPSLSPGLATLYFNKTECFCFNNQPLDGHAAADLPMTFIIDPQLPADVHTVTLSYTLYNITDKLQPGNVAAN